MKILAVFNTTDEDGNKTSETYSALFSKSRFDGVATEPFLRPPETNDALYVESPIPLETWMAVINRFSVRVGNWMLATILKDGQKTEAFLPLFFKFGK